eukprot:scaffold431_cov334-Pavlova_lutheri.AAC.109
MPAIAVPGITRRTSLAPVPFWTWCLPWECRNEEPVPSQPGFYGRPTAPPLGVQWNDSNRTGTGCRRKGMCRWITWAMGMLTGLCMGGGMVNRRMKPMH